MSASQESLRRLRGNTPYPDLALADSAELVVLAASLCLEAIKNESVARVILQRRLREVMANGIIIDGLSLDHGVEYSKREGAIVERPSPAGVNSFDWEVITPEEAERLRDKEAKIVSLYVPSRDIADDIYQLPLAQISFTVDMSPGYPLAQYRAALQDLHWRPIPRPEQLH